MAGVVLMRVRVILLVQVDRTFDVVSP